MRYCVIAIAAAVILSAVARPARGHKLNLFATVDGKDVSGEVYYTGGGPARGVKITAIDAQDRELGTSKSDAEGLFIVAGAADRCTHLRASSPDGHAVVFTMERDAKHTVADPASGPATGHTRSAGRLERKIDALRKQLDAHEHSIRLSDIIGGIGMIAGITGVAMYLKAGRKRKRD